MPIAERARGKALELGIAFDAHLDLTHRCNERCVHCYLVHHGHGELSTGEILAILEQLAAHGTFFLTLSGGEPLLRHDFFAILQHASALGFATRVKTNATLVGQREADLFRLAKVDRVEVSLYSHRPEIHDQVTGMRGSHQETLHGIRHLLDNHVRVTITHIFMRNNASGLDGVKRLADHLGVSLQIDPTLTPMINGDLAPLALNVPPPELEALMHSGLFSAEECPPLVPPSGSFLGARLCDAGHTHVDVAPNGDVWPCVQFPLLAGNLKTQTFEEVWRGAETLRRIRALRLKDLPVCSSCSHGAICSRCSGLAMMQGDLLGTSHLDCSKAQARTRIVPNISSTPASRLAT